MDASFEFMDVPCLGCANEFDVNECDIFHKCSSHGSNLTTVFGQAIRLNYN